MTGDEVVWPEPMADPDVEAGEDPVWHLLPPPERLRRLDRAEIDAILDVLADWRGPLVDRFRARAAGL